MKKIDNKMKKINNEFFECIMLIVLTTMGFIICYGKLKLEEPFYYKADSLYAYTQIKTIMDYGWHMKNPLLGAGEYNLYSFTTGNTGDFIIIKLISLFTDNVFLAYNLHLYLTYVFATIAAYFFLRKNSCEKVPSIVMALLFSFLPYHQLRIGHSLWLNCYFVCPLFLYQALKLMTETEIKIDKRWVIRNASLLIFISLFNIYYTFFGCIIIGGAFVARIFNEEKKNILIKKTLCVYGFILLGTIINFIDTIFSYIFAWANVSSSTVGNRVPQMAETFSFKLIQLFLPQYNHRNETLRNVARGYYNTTNSHFEGMFASCGIVISIGIVILLILLFIKHIDSSLKNVAILNLGMIMVGTVGGIGCIVAYVFPAVRSYARICAYISCCGVFIIARIISGLNWKKWTKYLVCVLILIVGFYDQTESFARQTQDNDILEKDIDAQFVQQINAICEDGDKVFQLPYESFPDGAFENLKGYLFSDKEIVWSYGNEVGTKKAAWAEMISACEVPQMVSELRNRGYNGIWISKTAWLSYYSEDEFQKLIDELEQIAGEPIMSGFEDFYYFDITGVIADNSMKAIYYANKASDVTEFVDAEGEAYFWNEKDAEFVFYNDNDASVTVLWNCKVASIGTREGNMIVSVNGESIIEQTVGEEEELSFSFICLPGENAVNISTDIESIGNPVGVRNSSFYIKELRIENNW